MDCELLSFTDLHVSSIVGRDNDQPVLIFITGTFFQRTPHFTNVIIQYTDSIYNRLCRGAVLIIELYTGCFANPTKFRNKLICRIRQNKIFKYSVYNCLIRIHFRSCHSLDRKSLPEFFIHRIHTDKTIFLNQT